MPAGNLLSAGVMALLAATLSNAQFQSWGWRIPFLLSAVLIVVGLWIRTTVEEKVVRYPRQLGIAVAARLGVDVAFYTFALFVLTYSPSSSACRSPWRSPGVLGGSALQLVLIPSVRPPVRQVRPTAGVPRGRARRGGLGLRVLPAARHRERVADRARHDRRARAPRGDVRAAGGVHHGAVRDEDRYSGASLGYQLAGILGGALAPIISIALLDRFGTTTAVSLYVVAALVFTVVALLVARETAAVVLDEDRPDEAGREQGLRPVFH